MSKRVNRHSGFRRTLLSVAILGTGSVPIYAQTNTGGIEEISVTATRRVESMQDVPIAVQALTSETLDQLDVSTIDDFIKYLPNVSAASMGPAQGNIYMRGLSIGALGTQGTASVGAWPNVAVYLDEQSTSIPGRNLDVYAADLERIEVLEGPQGTLFGAGAQAGVLRYITNKPKLDVTEGNISGSFGTTEHGSESGAAEGVLNIPLIEGKMALRAVVFNESRGGYIDNVASTFTRASTDIGFVNRTGGRVPTDSVVINNTHLVDDDINDVDYTGLRASVLYKINDDWDLLIAHSYQDMNASGVFYQHPNGADSGCSAVIGGSILQDCPNSTDPLDDLQVNVFNANSTDDKFNNTAWTLNGRVGELDLVYAGAYLKRDSDQIQDYTNYARGVWATYYQCTGFSGASVDKCYTPSATWSDETENENQSHELRFTTPGEWRLRGVAGVFWEKREVKDDTDWRYKSVPECTGVVGESCFLYLDPTESDKFASASFNNPGRRSSSTGFVDDFQRTYEQTAAFASVDFDILPDVLTLTVGTRYYEITNEMLGGNFGSFYCKVYGTGESGPCTGDLYGYGDLAPYGTNLDEQDPNDDEVTDNKSRVNLSWNITEDIMVYATWSEGYRMGGFNRGPGPGYLKDANGVAQWFVPLQYDSDELENIEVGWKTMLFDGRLQFNGAVYQETWENVQTGIFAPQLGLGNLTVGLNGPEYEVQGVEFQFVMAPMDGLTIQGSASYNESELMNSPILVNNNPASPTFGETITTAYVGGQPVSVTNVYGTEGDPLANSPEWQANARARYEWDLNGYDAYVQAGFTYQDEALSSATVVNQFTTDEWSTIDMSMGVAKDQWSLELYGSNILDETGPVYTSATQWILAEIPLRPRTLTVRLGYRFGD
jgi:outer membrane receptor protein involved in Fe transport